MLSKILLVPLTLALAYGTYHYTVINSSDTEIIDSLAADAIGKVELKSGDKRIAIDENMQKISRRNIFLRKIVKEQLDRYPNIRSKALDILRLERPLIVEVTGKSKQSEHNFNANMVIVKPTECSLDLLNTTTINYEQLKTLDCIQGNEIAPLFDSNEKLSISASGLDLENDSSKDFQFAMDETIKSVVIKNLVQNFKKDRTLFEI